MGVLDKFLDIMRLSDDDEYDSDDFYDDDEDDDDDYDAKSNKSLFKKSKDEYDDFDDSASKRGRTSSKPHSAGTSVSNSSGRSSNSSSKVTPMRPSVKKSPGMEVCVIKPTSMEESREITEILLNSSTIILNLEGVDLEIAQRIIDFISGAAFAINGNLQKVSNSIFLVTPTNVDISGDMQDLLGNTFDVPSMRTRF